MLEPPPGSAECPPNGCVFGDVNGDGVFNGEDRTGIKGIKSFLADYSTNAQREAARGAMHAWTAAQHDADKTGEVKGGDQQFLIRRARDQLLHDVRAADDTIRWHDRRVRAACEAVGLHLVQGQHTAQVRAEVGIRRRAPSTYEAGYADDSDTLAMGRQAGWPCLGITKA